MPGVVCIEACIWSVWRLEKCRTQILHQGLAVELEKKDHKLSHLPVL